MSMFRDLRHRIDISPHHFQNVHVCKIGKSRTQTSDRPEVICSMRSGLGEPDSEEEDSESSSKYRPISFSCDGAHTTFRPWNPYSCGIAAGICNSLIHFPISPGSRVFAIDCSLQTLSHFADVVGRNGYVIGVMSAENPKQPSQAQITKFLLKNPQCSVVTADVQNASLLDYERLLSLPLSSKFAFLMAMHSRLGENSPARVLAEESKNISKRIFEFVQCKDAAKVKNLVVCHWSSTLDVHSICNVLLNHVDILKKWKESSNKLDDAKSSDNHDAEQETEGNQDVSDHANSASDSGLAAGDQAPEKKSKKKKEKKESGKSDKVPRWVLLDLAIEHVMKDNGAKYLAELAANMKRTPDGRRTGAWVKEQLLLRPYLPNRALLLFKYGADGDGHRKGIGHRLPASRDNGELEAESQAVMAPSSTAMPTPSFLGGGGGGFAPPGPGAPMLPPGLAAPDAPYEALPPQPRSKPPSGPKNSADWENALGLSGPAMPTQPSNQSQSAQAPAASAVPSHASQLDRKAAAGEQRRQKGVKAEAAAGNAARGNKERDRAAQQYMALGGGMPPEQGRRPHGEPDFNDPSMGGGMWQPGPGDIPQGFGWGGGGPSGHGAPGGGGYGQRGGGGGGGGPGQQPFYQNPYGGPPGLPPGLSPAQMQGMGKGGWQGQAPRDGQPSQAQMQWLLRQQQQQQQQMQQGGGRNYGGKGKDGGGPPMPPSDGYWQF